MNKVGLAVYAYAGKPRGYPRCLWPDDLELPAVAWSREHWSFDESLKTHVHRSRRPAISIDEAIAALASKCVSK